MFWSLLIIVAGLLSVVGLSPIPIVAALILTAIGRTAEAPFVATVEAAGGSPDRPRGCLATIIAVLCVGFILMVALAAIVGVLGGL